MSNDILADAINEIDKINKKEATIQQLVAKVNEAIANMNKITEWIQTTFIKGREEDVEKESKYSAILEYLTFYVILLLSVSASLGYFVFRNTNWEGVLNLALVLSTTILLGLVKQILWNKIASKERNNRVLEQEIRAQETALSAQSIEYTRVKTRNSKLVKYIQKTDPQFTMEKLYDTDTSIGYENLPVPKPIKSLVEEETLDDIEEKIDTIVPPPIVEEKKKENKKKSRSDISI